MKRVSTELNQPDLPFDTYIRFVKDAQRANASLKFVQMPNDTIRVRLRKKIIVEGKLAHCIDQLQQIGVPSSLVKKAHLQMRQLKGRAA